MYAFVRDLLFPKRCIHCGAWGALVCTTCLCSIDYLTEQYCFSCKQSSVWGYAKHGCKRRVLIDQLVSLYWYRGVGRSIITQLKFTPRLTALSEVLLDLIIRGVPNDIFPANSVLVPIPLHRSRYAKRGFNQSEIIASVLAEHIGGTVSPSLLTRIRSTRPQSGIHNRSARKVNVSGAFKLSEDVQLPTSVILVDDVITSGYTLSECARVIRRLSSDTFIGAFTLARG